MAECLRNNWIKMIKTSGSRAVPSSEQNMFGLITNLYNNSLKLINCCCSTKHFPPWNWPTEEIIEVLSWLNCTLFGLELTKNRGWHYTNVFLFVYPKATHRKRLFPSCFYLFEHGKLYLPQIDILIKSIEKVLVRLSKNMKDKPD